MERSRVKALDTIAYLSEHLYRPHRKIEISEDGESYNPSYNREMLYMHEHIFHHCALLKIELGTIPLIQLDPCFGFAKSTLKHMELETNQIGNMSLSYARVNGKAVFTSNTDISTLIPSAQKT